jgi:uncharacterized damage-inducible protein DinB
MINVESAKSFLHYSDWANSQLLQEAARLSDQQLDRPIAMGRGSLRSTLLHIWAGESVWLSRWQGRAETPWPDEDESVPVASITQRFETVFAERRRFVEGLTDARLGEVVTYRDSKGSLFKATLGDMIMQGIIHSTHHRAQVVNMIRQVEGEPPELDYMMRVRRPAN